MKVLLYQAGNPESHKKLGKELSQLKPGEYVVTVKKKKHIRSLDQNSYYWAILTLIAAETGEFDRDRLHNICKSKFNSKLEELPRNGGSILVVESTSKLDSDEFTKYINRVKSYARQELGIVINEQRDMTYQQWEEINNHYEKTFTG